MTAAKTKNEKPSPLEYKGPAPEPSPGYVAALVPAPEANTQLLKMGELVDVARRYQRSIVDVFQEAKDMISIDKDAAKNCGYSIPRGGKNITGPSVRLAEIAHAAWGNIMISTDNFEVIRDQTTGAVKIKVTGYGVDLQKNNGFNVFEVRKVQPKKGKPVDDDMIDNTVRQTRAVVYREIVFKLIPKVYVNALYDFALTQALGSNKHEERVDRMLKGFAEEFQVSEDEVLLYLGKVNRQYISPDDVKQLIGLTTEIREGNITVDEVFRPREGTEDEEPASEEQQGELA